MNETIKKKIIEIEWPMFHNVNGDTRASCQNDPSTFVGMRGAQYDAWTDEIGESYYMDLCAAEFEGRNLPREKYIHMMSSTDPAGYEILKGSLPPVSPRKESLVSELIGIILAQTDKLREKYPLIALGGRPLYAYQEAYGSTSIETYQKGELYTYSEKTLSLLLDHIKDMEKRGESYAYIVQENSVLAAGYPSLAEAEQMMLSAAILKSK